MHHDADGGRSSEPVLVCRQVTMDDRAEVLGKLSKGIYNGHDYLYATFGSFAGVTGERWDKPAVVHLGSLSFLCSTRWLNPEPLLPLRLDRLFLTNGPPATTRP